MSKTVTVFGDINIDIIIYSDIIPTEDISILAKNVRIAHGGVGGNISVALRRFYLNVNLIGAPNHHIMNHDFSTIQVFNNYALLGIMFNSVSHITTVPLSRIRHFHSRYTIQHHQVKHLGEDT